MNLKEIIAPASSRTMLRKSNQHEIELEAPGEDSAAESENSSNSKNSRRSSKSKYIRREISEMRKEFQTAIQHIIPKSYERK